MRNALAFALILLACLIGGRAGAVQPVVELGERVADPTPGFLREKGDTAVAADGSYLVVWQDFFARAIYARAFTPAGVARGAARQVSVGRRFTTYPNNPRVASVPDGRFVVVWIDPQELGSRKLLGRLLDASGAPLGPPVEIDRSDWPAPAIVADAAGVITVAWTRFEWTGALSQVVVRRLDGTRPELPAVGWPLGPGVDVVDVGAGSAPSLALVPGGMVVARALSSTAMAVSQLGLDGQLRGEERVLQAPAPQDTANQLRATVSADGTGRSTLVWHELQRPLIDRVRAQRFAADGTPASEPVDLVTRAHDPEDPDRGLILGDVASRRDGTLLVTWTDGLVYGNCPAPDPWTICSNFEEGGVVHASVFAADGTLLGDAAAPPGELFLGIPFDIAGGAADADGGWLITYAGRSSEAAKVTFDPCGGPAASLCLDNRFRLQVEWRTDDFVSAGTPLSVSADTGAFWFFSPSNVELVAKVLDGTAVNGKHWVFFASLTDVEFDLVVTDTATGAVKRYHNPQGTLASRADTGAFDGGASLAAVAGPMSDAFGASLERAPVAIAAAEAATTCPAGALCLAGGRFVVTAKWRLDGSEGAATPIGWTGETGTFWFFSPSNVELAVKVLDGRGVNGHFWVLFASLSDVDFDLEALDTVTGQRRTYHNPRGTMASRADIEAF